MIAKLETMLGTVQQNKEQSQNPHKSMGAIIRNESTITEQPP